MFNQQISSNTQLIFSFTIMKSCTCAVQFKTSTWDTIDEFKFYLIHKLIFVLIMSRGQVLTQPRVGRSNSWCYQISRLINTPLISSSKGIGALSQIGLPASPSSLERIPPSLVNSSLGGGSARGKCLPVVLMSVCIVVVQRIWLGCAMLHVEIVVETK